MTSVKKIDHVAIAVRSIDESRIAFEGIYGARYLSNSTSSPTVINRPACTEIARILVAA